nr:hypothetical protein [SAR324 cluster bacterium]
MAIEQKRNFSVASSVEDLDFTTELDKGDLSSGEFEKIVIEKDEDDTPMLVTITPGTAVIEGEAGHTAYHGTITEPSNTTFGAGTPGIEGGAEPPATMVSSTTGNELSQQTENPIVTDNQEPIPQKVALESLSNNENSVSEMSFAEIILPDEASGANNTSTSESSVSDVTATVQTSEPAALNTATQFSFVGTPVSDTGAQNQSINQKADATTVQVDSSAPDIVNPSFNTNQTINQPVQASPANATTGTIPDTGSTSVDTASAENTTPAAGQNCSTQATDQSSDVPFAENNSQIEATNLENEVFLETTASVAEGEETIVEGESRADEVAAQNENPVEGDETEGQTSQNREGAVEASQEDTIDETMSDETAEEDAASHAEDVVSQDQEAIDGDEAESGTSENRDGAEVQAGETVQEDTTGNGTAEEDVEAQTEDVATQGED